MTMQQQIAERVMLLSDEGAELVGQLLSGLNPMLFMNQAPLDHQEGKPDVSKRFGAGKGIIVNTEAFDGFNEEIADWFKEFDG